MTATQIRRHTIEALPMLSPLQDALLRSGVKILDTDDVDAYKREKVREATAPPMFRQSSGFFGRILDFFRDTGEPDPRKVRGSSSLANLAWRRYRVGGCQEGVLALDEVTGPGLDVPTPIPAEIRDVCNRIAETGVEASFHVDQLDTDPFMIVADGKEMYFVGVWDEAGFIG